LAALAVQDLRHVTEGLQITIRKSKTDQEGSGHTIAVPHRRHIKPVQAVREWLEEAGIAEGPVFRPVARSGRFSVVRFDRQYETDHHIKPGTATLLEEIPGRTILYSTSAQHGQELVGLSCHQKPEPTGGMGFIGAEPIDRCSAISR
jgi:hypothetical protein